MWAVEAVRSLTGTTCTCQIQWSKRKGSRICKHENFGCYGCWLSFREVIIFHQAGKTPETTRWSEFLEAFWSGKKQARQCDPLEVCPSITWKSNTPLGHHTIGLDKNAGNHHLRLGSLSYIPTWLVIVEIAYFTSREMMYWHTRR